MTQFDPKIREKIYDLGLKVNKVPKAPFRAMLELWADDRRDQSDPREEPVTHHITGDCSDENPYGLVPLDPPWLSPFEIAARLAALHHWGVKSMGLEPVVTHDWYQSLDPEVMSAFIDLMDQVPNMNGHDVRLLEQCLVGLEEIAEHVQAAIQANDTNSLTRLERAVLDLVEQQVPERDAKATRGVSRDGAGEDDRPVVLEIDTAGKTATLGDQVCAFKPSANWNALVKLARNPGVPKSLEARRVSLLKSALKDGGLDVVASAIDVEREGSPGQYSLRTAHFRVQVEEPTPAT